jgi:hypothetical protein
LDPFTVAVLGAVEVGVAVTVGDGGGVVVTVGVALLWLF